LLWLARRSGTHWQMNCELTLLVVIGLNQLCSLSSLPFTSIFSALKAIAVMRYINWWLTFTLTMSYHTSIMPASTGSTHHASIAWLLALRALFSGFGHFR